MILPFFFKVQMIQFGDPVFDFFYLKASNSKIYFKFQSQLISFERFSKEDLKDYTISKYRNSKNQTYCVCVFMNSPSGSIRCPFPTRQYLRSAPRPMTALLQITLPWILHLETPQTNNINHFYFYSLFTEVVPNLNLV